MQFQQNILEMYKFILNKMLENDNCDSSLNDGYRVPLRKTPNYIYRQTGVKFWPSV